MRSLILRCQRYCLNKKRWYTHTKTGLTRFRSGNSKSTRSAALTCSILFFGLERKLSDKIISRQSLLLLFIESTQPVPRSVPLHDLLHKTFQNLFCKYRFFDEFEILFLFNKKLIEIIFFTLFQFVKFYKHSFLVLCGTFYTRFFYAVNNPSPFLHGIPPFTFIIFLMQIWNKYYINKFWSWSIDEI